MKTLTKDLIVTACIAIAMMTSGLHAEDIVSPDIRKATNFLGDDNESGLILLLIDKLNWGEQKRDGFIEHIAQESPAYRRAKDQFAQQEAKEEFKRTAPTALKDKASKITDWVIDGGAPRKYDFEQQGYWLELPQYYKPSGAMENAVKFPTDLKVLVRVPREIAKEKSSTQDWGKARFRVAGNVDQMEANPDAALPTRTCYVFLHFNPKMIQITLGDGTVLSQSPLQ